MQQWTKMQTRALNAPRLLTLTWEQRHIYFGLLLTAEAHATGLPEEVEGDLQLDLPRVNTWKELGTRLAVLLNGAPQKGPAVLVALQRFTTAGLVEMWVEDRDGLLALYQPGIDPIPATSRPPGTLTFLARWDFLEPPRESRQGERIKKARDRERRRGDSPKRGQPDADSVPRPDQTRQEKEHSRPDHGGGESVPSSMDWTAAGLDRLLRRVVQQLTEWAKQAGTKAPDEDLILRRLETLQETTPYRVARNAIKAALDEIMWRLNARKPIDSLGAYWMKILDGHVNASLASTDYEFTPPKGRAA